MSDAPDQGFRAALVLQGGGALGAYHVGAYEALVQFGIRIDWVAGISIGAFNAAIIAGNPRTRAVEQLDRFWRRITWPVWVSADAMAAGPWGAPRRAGPKR